MNDCKIQVKYTKIMININNNTINLICNVILSVDNTNIITRKAIATSFSCVGKFEIIDAK